MAGKNVLQQFQALAESLRDNDALRVVTAEFHKPATKAQLDEARNYFKLTKAMESFYAEANGLTIQWEAREEKELPKGAVAKGYIDLLPVQDVFSDWKETIYSDENDRFRPLHPLDFFIEEACAALYLDGSKNPEVYYHYLGEEMSPLGVDFAKYLRLLLKTRGFWYWQVAVAHAQKKEGSAPTSVEEKSFWQIMPELFPDFKQARFKRMIHSDGSHE